MPAILKLPINLVKMTSLEITVLMEKIFMRILVVGNASNTLACTKVM